MMYRFTDDRRQLTSDVDAAEWELNFALEVAREKKQEDPYDFTRYGGWMAVIAIAGILSKFNLISDERHDEVIQEAFQAICPLGEKLSALEIANDPTKAVKS